MQTLWYLVKIPAGTPRCLITDAQSVVIDSLFCNICFKIALFGGVFLPLKTSKYLVVRFLLRALSSH